MYNPSNLRRAVFFMTLILASLWEEATVVGIVCACVLVLFVIAGIRQIIKDKE